MLQHIYHCSSQVDISNFFLLICSHDIESDHLEIARTLYSTDNEVMATLDVIFTDAATESLNENQMVTLPESFCFSPWAHLEISSKGEFKPCCVYRESVTAPDGKPYNINNYSVAEVYSSEYLVNLRRAFLAGQRPPGCKHCWYKEQSMGKSNRHWIRDHLGLQAELLHIEHTHSLDNLISLDLKLGNLCNFRCRICNEESSSSIAQEKVTHFQSSIDIKALNARGKWVDNDKIWKMFEQLGNQLVNIDFYGGEPFLIKQAEIFLDYLIQNQWCNKIRLHYNSNGSVFPEHLFDKWKNFREVDIAFSIDNIGSKFELERGGQWEQIQNNLSRFQKARLPNMVFSVFTTVNIQNVCYLGDIVEWFESQTFNALIFNILQHPDFMSITTMNPELTALAIKKLNQIDNEALHRYNIITIIDLLKLNKSDCSNTKTADYMKKLDQIRHQDFSRTHPEIASIIYQGKQHGQTI